LDSGIYQGVDWELSALMSDGHLCMALAAPNAPIAPFSSQCQFDASLPIATEYASGLGPSDSTAFYGPAPMTAAFAALDANSVVATKPFPNAAGLPVGRYWISLLPAGMKATTKPTLLDANHKIVAFQPFN
jgi:hypothetical protein